MNERYTSSAEKPKKRFADVVPQIFQKLAEAGFDEWSKYWDTQIKKEG